jgi:hypothetical protein
MLKSTTVNLDNSYLKNISIKDLKGQNELSYNGFNISVNSLITSNEMVIKVERVTSVSIIGKIICNGKYNKKVGEIIEISQNDITDILQPTKIFFSTINNLENKLKEYSSKGNSLLDSLIKKMDSINKSIGKK